MKILSFNASQIVSLLLTAVICGFLLQLVFNLAKERETGDFRHFMGVTICMNIEPLFISLSSASIHRFHVDLFVCFCVHLQIYLLLTGEMSD